MRRLLVLVVALALGAVVAGGASAAPARGFAQGVGEFGFLDIEQPGQFAFSAHATDADGSAQGHMRVQDLFGSGEDIQARVRCLAVRGNVAVVGAEPLMVPPSGAHAIYLAVQDNGGGDLVTAVATVAPVTPASCASVLTFAVPNVPVEGHVIVRDA